MHLCIRSFVQKSMHCFGSKIQLPTKNLHAEQVGTKNEQTEKCTHAQQGWGQVLEIRNIFVKKCPKSESFLSTTLHHVDRHIGIKTPPRTSVFEMPVWRICAEVLHTSLHRPRRSSPRRGRDAYCCLNEVPPMTHPPAEEKG